MKGVTLILGASEQDLHIVFAQNGEVQYAQECAIKSNGTELLGPLITESLKKNCLSPQRISRIACIAGPGSFTGLRLILTTAVAMRRALSIPLATLNYLHVIAASACAFIEIQQLLLSYTLRVITYARKHFLYVQDFLLNTTFLVPITKPQIIPIKASLQIKEPMLFVGSGVQYNYPFFEEQSLVNPNILLFQKKISISSQALIQLIDQIPQEKWQQNDPEPLYLRQCDAVENLSSIALKQGKDPEYAYLTLEKILTQHPLLLT